MREAQQYSSGTWLCKAGCPISSGKGGLCPKSFDRAAGVLFFEVFLVILCYFTPALTQSARWREPQFHSLGRLPHGQNLATPTSLCARICLVWVGRSLESGMKGRRVDWMFVNVWYMGTVWCGFLWHLAHSVNSHPASEKILRASIGKSNQTKQATFYTNEGG